MTRRDFNGWQAYWLEPGPLALALVENVCGRVMGIRWHGRDHSFVHPGLAGRIEDVAAAGNLHAFKRGQGFT